MSKDYTKAIQSSQSLGTIRKMRCKAVENKNTKCAAEYHRSSFFLFFFHKDTFSSSGKIHFEHFSVFSWYE